MCLLVILREWRQRGLGLKASCRGGGGCFADCGSWGSAGSHLLPNRQRVIGKVSSSKTAPMSHPLNHASPHKPWGNASLLVRPYVSALWMLHLVAVGEEAAHAYSCCGMSPPSAPGHQLSSRYLLAGQGACAPVVTLRGERLGLRVTDWRWRRRLCLRCDRGTRRDSAGRGGLRRALRL